jgi:poly-beta-1,6-N-acetyl-D-glucosamine synthase
MSAGVWLFVLSILFVLYVLFGYPLLLALRSRRPKPLTRRFEPRSVSVLLPVRNGAKWIGAKLDTLAKLDYPQELIQILVISDGSTDASDDLVLDARSRFHDLQLIRVPHGGKARALNAALEQATGEILFLTDVRQPLEPSSLRTLVEAFADPSAGAVSGELIIMDGRTREEANVGLYWKYEKWIRRRQSLVGSVPGATGAIYCIRRELARKLPPDTLLDDVYLPMCAYFAGKRVLFEPNARAYDYPTALDNEFRRKVRTLAGVYQLIGFFPRLIVPGHPLWLDFVSHKLGRLLVPFALIAIALSSFALPEPWRLLAVLGQVAFYGLAFVDTRVGDGSKLKRLTSPIRTFVVLMAAAFSAASILWRPAGSFWSSPSQG